MTISSSVVLRLLNKRCDQLWGVLNLRFSKNRFFTISGGCCCWAGDNWWFLRKENRPPHKKNIIPFQGWSQNFIFSHLFLKNIFNCNIITNQAQKIEPHYNFDRSDVACPSCQVVECLLLSCYLLPSYTPPHETKANFPGHAIEKTTVSCHLENFLCFLLLKVHDFDENDK